MLITESEVKEYLKIDYSEDDTLISTILAASIAYCKTKLSRPILDSEMTVETTWEVPEDVRIAIYLLCSHWYDQRSPVGRVTVEIALTVNDILSPYKFWHVG